MSVNLTIRNVSNDLAGRLRARAERSHRSLQGEVMAILEEAAGERKAGGFGDEQRGFRDAEIGAARLTDVVAEIGKLGLPRPAQNESTQMIREDRDSR